MLQMALDCFRTTLAHFVPFEKSNESMKNGFSWTSLTHSVCLDMMLQMFLLCFRTTLTHFLWFAFCVLWDENNRFIRYLIFARVTDYEICLYFFECFAICFYFSQCYAMYCDSAGQVFGDSFYFIIDSWCPHVYHSVGSLGNRSECICLCTCT